MDVKNAQKIREKLAKRLKRPKMVRITIRKRFQKVLVSSYGKRFQCEVK